MKPWASHELSNDDDGETSSASEDSTASSKRATEASAPLPPSSKRARSNLQQPGWLPVSETKTFQTGTGQQQQPQQRLPRLAALETLLSPVNHQQENIHQQSQRPGPGSFQQQQEQQLQQQQHHRRGYPVGPHPPTTGVLRSNAPPMQLPPLADAARDSVPTISMSSSAGSGSRPSSTSTSPTCSPGLSSSSPAAYGGRFRSQPPAPLPAPPTCIQGQAGTAGTSGGSSINRRWLEVRTTSSAGGAGGVSDLRHRMPRIGSLSNTGSRHAVPSAGSRPHSWHPAAAAAATDAGTQAAAKSAGESRGDFFAAQTTVPYSRASSGYGEIEGDRAPSGVRGRQHESGAPWTLQQQRQQPEEAWQNHHLTAVRAGLILRLARTEILRQSN